MSRFCRHNRFVAECPICSKGTLLDPERTPERRPRPAASRQGRPGAGRAARAAAATRASRGPFASAGPYEGGREVRLEKVPGGLRFASWQAGQLVKEAPRLVLRDLPALLSSAAEQGLLPDAGVREQAEPEPAVGSYGASPGRAGELRDELRVERLDDAQLRIARWVMRPNRGWELQEAPVLLPAERFLHALAAAGAEGVLASGDPTR